MVLAIRPLPLAQADVEQLQQIYVIGDPPSVYAQVEENPAVLPVLYEAHGKIATYFPGATTYLEVVIDPEIVEEDRRLVVFISPSESPEEAVEIQTRFDDDWWLDASEPVDDQLAIVLEYR